MDELTKYRARLAGLLGEIAVEEGLQPTRIEGVHVFKGSKSVPRAPMVYRPHIIIVGQGRKRAYTVADPVLPWVQYDGGCSL